MEKDEVVLTPGQQDSLAEKLKKYAGDQFYEINGELILKPLHQTNMCNMINNIPITRSADELFGVRSTSTMSNNNKYETVNNNTPVVQNIQVTLPNITNQSGYDQVLKALEQTKLEALQDAHKRRR